MKKCFFLFIILSTFGCSLFDQTTYRTSKLDLTHDNINIIINTPFILKANPTNLNMTTKWTTSDINLLLNPNGHTIILTALEKGSYFLDAESSAEKYQGVIKKEIGSVLITAHPVGTIIKDNEIISTPEETTPNEGSAITAGGQMVTYNSIKELWETEDNREVNFNRAKGAWETEDGEKVYVQTVEFLDTTDNRINEVLGREFTVSLFPSDLNSDVFFFTSSDDLKLESQTKGIAVFSSSDIGIFTITAVSSAFEQKTIVVTIVLPSQAEASFYLNKRDIIANIGEIHKIKVITTLSENKITWQILEDQNEAIQILGSGKEISMVAKKSGLAVISVTGEDSSEEFFNSTVEVLVMATDGQTKYLIASTPTYEITEDETDNLTINLEGGDVLDQLGIAWSTPDTDKIRLIGTSGNSIKVEAKEVGRASVLASHPDSLNTFEFQITVVPNNKYIQLSTTAIILEPHEVYTNLHAYIEDGTYQDYQAIQWSVSDRNIVQIVGSGKSITLRAKNEGETQILAKNKKGTSVLTVIVNPQIVLEFYNTTIDVASLKGEFAIPFFAFPESMQVTATSTNEAAVKILRVDKDKVIVEGNEEASNTQVIIRGRGYPGAADTISVRTTLNDIFTPIIEGFDMNKIKLKKYGEQAVITYTNFPNEKATLSGYDRNIIEIDPNGGHEYSYDHDKKIGKGTIIISFKFEGSTTLTMKNRGRSQTATIINEYPSRQTFPIKLKKKLRINKKASLYGGRFKEGRHITDSSNKNNVWYGPAEVNEYEVIIPEGMNAAYEWTAKILFTLPSHQEHSIRPFEIIRGTEDKKNVIVEHVTHGRIKRNRLNHKAKIGKGGTEKAEITVVVSYGIDLKNKTTDSMHKFEVSLSENYQWGNVFEKGSVLTFDNYQGTTRW